MRLKRRFGRFKIDTRLLNNTWEGTLSRIMGACIILRAECNFMHDTIEYQAYSFRFRELEEGEIIPEYTFQLTQEGDMAAMEHSAKPESPSHDHFRDATKMIETAVPAIIFFPAGSLGEEITP